MRILGLDTATRATTAAVWETDGDHAVERRDDPAPGARPAHTPRLLTLAAAALADAGTDWTGLDRIAVGTGPGTFTGIRIGVATARSLAATLAIPISGVSSLRAVASGAVMTLPDDPDAPGVLAVLDARRGEVFAAGWTRAEVRDPRTRPDPDAAALAPEALAAVLADGGEWSAVGEGAVLYRDVLERAGVRVEPDDAPAHRISAIEICRLALDMAPGAVADVVPEYLRLPDAELSRRAAAR